MKSLVVVALSGLLTLLSTFATAAADYDSEKVLKKALGVTKQSTIVVFKKGKEVARSTGETQYDSLAVLLQSAIS